MVLEVRRRSNADTNSAMPPAARGRKPKWPRSFYRGRTTGEGSSKGGEPSLLSACFSSHRVRLPREMEHCVARLNEPTSCPLQRSARCCEGSTRIDLERPRHRRDTRANVPVRERPRRAPTQFSSRPAERDRQGMETRSVILPGSWPTPPGSESLVRSRVERGGRGEGEGRAAAIPCYRLVLSPPARLPARGEIPDVEAGPREKRGSSLA